MEAVRRLGALREDWPDALRMVVSAVLAATVSSLLHLPEMYWAVLSAVIVSRPSGGGSGKAGAARLIGTVFGSAVALAVIGARGWHVPEIALLAIAMIPLSLFITAFDEFRTAPVAAVILLSSTSALVSPFHVALLRMLQITIGSLASTAVGVTVLPSRGHGRVFSMGASILTRIGAALDAAFDEKRDDAKLDAAHDDIRRDLRDLGALVKTKRGVTRAQARMVRLLSRLQQDAVFVGRVVGTGLRRPTAAEYAHAVHGVCRDVADAMLDPESDAMPRCREALDTASAAFAHSRRADVDVATAALMRGHGSAMGGAAIATDTAAAAVGPGVRIDVVADADGVSAAADAANRRPAVVALADGNHTHTVDALDFLLETVGKDLHDLIRVLQGPR